MLVSPNELKTQVTRSDWFRTLSKFEQPVLGKALWQLVSTFVPFIALWALMVYIVNHRLPLWYLIAPVLVTAGLMVRIYIFFHDCTHSSFFASRTANRIVGTICGILTFTPFEMWQKSHIAHHSTAEDLDRRGSGDIWTMTVEEYLAAPLRKRFVYRLFRNPVFLFGFGAPFLFLFVQRFADKEAKASARRSVTITNLGLLALMIMAHFIPAIGLKTYLIIQIPCISIAATFGVWLFYVQHQYEEVYWARHDEWDPIRAALDGSSYYKLPVVLQWFSGNIGLHHIHHLRPRIPNYNLQQCYNEITELQQVEPLTLRRSLKSLFLALWDEKQQKMVNFQDIKSYRKQTVS